MMTLEETRARRRRERLRMSPEQRHLQAFVRRSNQRARAYGVPGILSAPDVRQVAGPCAYCGGAATEWDHVNALRSGGPNDVTNLVPSCRPCNQARPRPYQRTYEGQCRLGHGAKIRQGSQLVCRECANERNRAWRRRGLVS